jgi:hypothetical protein
MWTLASGFFALGNKTDKETKGAGVAPVVESLPSKLKALSSTPSTEKQKKKKKLRED